ncbi:MAG: hypothetical protein RL417_1897 [Pseudomonadota bacterium]|jgi:ferredoxin--NADP+ reductase
MLNASIVKRVDVTPELVILSVKPDGGVPEFQPGQYVALGLFGSAERPGHFPPEREAHAPDKIIKRAYSIGSSPANRESLEFYIAIVPDGGLTSRLALVREGDRVFLAPKITGTFTLEHVSPERNLVLVSTGTGLAPFMSMVRTPATWSAGRRITIVHGVRHAADLGYRAELEALQERGIGLVYHPVVSRDAAWSGARGHVQSLFEGGVVGADPARDNVFLCGNPAMVEGMETLLVGRGYSVHSKKTPGNLHLEKYW